MRLFDPFLFLIGNRNAIQRIAGSYWSILVGFLLVISAGIARNYDHLAFLKNPEWFLGPILASFASCCLLYWFGLRKHIEHPKARWTFFSFLSLYWMTAPCAWIYGFPVEAFTDIVTATKWNVAFFVIVSVWRVALMIRCLHVLTGASVSRSTFSILIPACVIMFSVSFIGGIGMVQIMSGVRLPPHQVFLKVTNIMVTMISFVTFIVLSIFAIAYRSSAPKHYPHPLPWKKSPPFPKKAFMLSFTVIFIALLCSLPMQLKVSRNAQLQTFIEAEQYQQAIDYASQFEAHDFNQIHYLPPEPHAYLADSHTLKLLELCSPSTPKWLANTWGQQLTERYKLEIEYIREVNPYRIASLSQALTVEEVTDRFGNPTFDNDHKSTLYYLNDKGDILYRFSYSHQIDEKIISRVDVIRKSTPHRFTQIWPNEQASEQWDKVPTEVAELFAKPQQDVPRREPHPY